MSHKSVLVPEGTLRSPLIRIIAILCALTAAAGLLSLASLLIPGAFGLLDAVSTTKSIKFSWTFIHTAFILFGTVCAGLMAGGLFLTLRNKLSKGADLIAQGCRILRLVITGIGIAAAAIFVIRLFLYIWHFLGVNGGIISLFSGVLSEFFLAAIAVLIFLKTRQFLEAVGDTAASIDRTITSGILTAPSISMFSATGFLILGIVNGYLAINRITTICAWTGHDIPALSSLVLYCSVAMFLIGCAADILLFFFLKKFKNTSEYLLYKGTPAEKD